MSEEDVTTTPDCTCLYVFRSRWQDLREGEQSIIYGKITDCSPEEWLQICNYSLLYSRAAYHDGAYQSKDSTGS